MSARSDAVQQQINEMRGSARAARYDIEKLTEQADDWQRKANEARKLAAVLEEKARIWDAIADGLDTGALHDIAAPLGTGRDDRPSNADMHTLQGRLMAELPGLDAWSIHCGELGAMLHRSAGGSRRAILGIAERYGIGYVEDRRGEQICVSAEGEIDDIPVKIWCLLPADDEQPVPEAGPHRGRPDCEGCPDCIGYTDPNVTDHQDAEAEAAQEAWIAQGEAAVDEALDARDAESEA